MTMKQNLPAGWAHVLLGFTGTHVPLGAACTFGADNRSSSRTPQQIADSVKTLWETWVRPVTVNKLTLAKVRVKLGPNDEGPFTEISANVVGQDALDSLSAAVCYLIKKSTAIGGKHGAGRMFHPGLPEAQVGDGGAIVAGFITELETAWDGFYGQMTANGNQMALLHAYGTYVNSKGQTVTVPPRSPDLITSLAIDPTVATQRRRQRR